MDKEKVASIDNTNTPITDVQDNNPILAVKTTAVDETTGIGVTKTVNETSGETATLTDATRVVETSIEDGADTEISTTGEAPTEVDATVAEETVIDETAEATSTDRTVDALYDWLTQNFGSVEVEKKPPRVVEPYKWCEIHVYISSTRCDTQSERDAIVKRVIPKVNRKLAELYIRVIPIDLRWGLSKTDTKDTYAIQKSCFSLVDKCRNGPGESPWFIALGTERYGGIFYLIFPISYPRVT